MLVHNVLYGCQNGSNKPFPNLSHYLLSLSKVNLNSKNNGPILLFKTMQQLAKGDISSITGGKSVVNTKPVVGNLVSWFDSQFGIQSTHISLLSSTQRVISHMHIHKFLSPQETKNLVHAFVTSHVD